MCGIAGIISPKGFKLRNLSAMSDAMVHRGPDGYGFLAYGPSRGITLALNRPMNPEDSLNSVVGLAHRRLAIIDLSLENSQPMKSDAAEVAVCYNGEIYNYVELRAELESLGYYFTTSGDTEVLLNAYLAWGTDAFARFNGQWAFALLDGENRRLYLCRDRFGIKPLFYTVSDGTLYFASEIKSLWAVGSLNLKPNEDVVYRYLSSGVTDDTDYTFFKGVFRLPSATFVAIDLNALHPQIQPERYWNFPQKRFAGTQNEAVEKFRELFFDAVRIHARSDVPVGTCLSGGMDSSSILCVSEILRDMGQIPSYSHTAFGYTPTETEFSEKKYMQAVIDATKAKMHFVELSPEDLSEALPQIIHAQDEPFGSASIAAQWAVFKRARQEGMTVMLDGQGADEILGGYHSYFNVIASLYIKNCRLLSFLELKSQYEKEMGPFPYPLKSALLAMAPSLVKRTWGFLRSRNALPVYGNPSLAFMQPNILEKKHTNPIKKKFDSLNDVLQQHVQSTSLPALLRYEDRNSMIHSLESRVPFLDYRLVDYVFTLPDNLKICGVSTKQILRLAIKNILPNAVMQRKDKVGFKPSPLMTFAFAQNQKDSLLQAKTPFEKRWFSKQGLARLFGNKNRDIDTEFLLWRVINTKLWARQFWG